MSTIETNSTLSRRNLIRQLTLMATAIGGIPAGIDAQGKPRQLSPFYLPPQSPLQPGPAGIDIRTWVRSAQTNKQFSCVETAVAPRTMGPAPHIHKDLDELMLVLEGTATVLVEGATEEIAAGGWHFRPRQLEHTFWNAGNKPLRFIDMYFNQNFEDFLEELFHQIFADMAKHKLTPADPAIAKRLADLDARFGVTTFPEKRQPIIDKYRLKG